MSRRSHAFAEGTQKFIWRIEELPSGEFRATCLSFPHIQGVGPSEQFALTKGKEAADLASRKSELGI